MDKKTRLVGLLVGLAVGFVVGSGTGIAGFWLFFVLGGVLGWYVSPDIIRFKKLLLRGRG